MTNVPAVGRISRMRSPPSSPIGPGPFTSPDEDTSDLGASIK
eukprot:CAMPEP_0184411738 /NCGR_PEP_ID=MMETSP0738-20130409/5919_1 /TAXON_ID=385413 /ORGANISM="Thalassiosira miniscula, Strain CCMP1093" /LENGTH=41 /DNA_ID= /DNA_START= /DNA_END= /DNA_ORIENTATION=